MPGSVPRPRCFPSQGRMGSRSSRQRTLARTMFCGWHRARCPSHPAAAGRQAIQALSLDHQGWSFTAGDGPESSKRELGKAQALHGPAAAALAASLQQGGVCRAAAGAQPTGTNTSRDRASGPSEWEQTIIQTRKQRDLSTIFPHEPALLQRITSCSCSTALGRATCGQEGLQKTETGGREKNAIPQQNTTHTRCLYQPPLDRAVVSFHFAEEESAARGSYKSSVTLSVLPPHLHS